MTLNADGFEILAANFTGLIALSEPCTVPQSARHRQGRSHVLLRRLTVRYAVAAPIFVFAAWLFVTGALGPSS